MRTSQLEYFMAVAETLSFTRASELCHVAQPAISQQIQALEKELGFPLFDRTTKGVALTAAGRQYYQDVAGVVDLLHRADQRASAIAHGASGSLDFGVASSGQMGVFQIIRRFTTLYPEVHVGLHRAVARTQDEQLRTGAYDIVLSPLCAFANSSGISLTRSTREPLRIIMSARHPLAARRTLSIEDLLPYPHIIADAPNDDLLRQTYPYEADHPELTVLRAEDQDIAWMMMALGLGIEAVPETIIASLERGYTVREVEGYEASLEIGWAYLTDNANPALQKFLDFVAHQNL